MLIPDNIHPEKSIYYNGAFVLKAIKENQVMSLMELYLETQTYKEMSMPVFILCVDWLFLINLVKLNKQGGLETCS